MNKTLVALLVAGLFSGAATAQIAVSANDNKQINVAGVGSVVRDAAPDSVTVIATEAPVVFDPLAEVVTVDTVGAV